MQETAIQRNVTAILGLPFDMLTLDEAVAKVHAAIDTREPCFISTPNLNFLMASQTDKQFRQSVINSDLNLADGMPVIWISRLLKLPTMSRVAGSDLFAKLMQAEGRHTNPVKAFFFGGQEGVAEQACEQLNALSCAVQCVGTLNPGFGTIEEMSQAAYIKAINDSKAEFVIVSLGAKKGQAWIEHNRHQLDAPVISHLGAVVNFVAGTVIRAPAFWQRTGLEWLWRIKEEPALWQRYGKDALLFFKVLCLQMLPYALCIRRNQHRFAKNPPIEVEKVVEKPDEVTITLKGVAVSDQLIPLRELTSQYHNKSINLSIDLQQVAYVDACFIGFLILLDKYTGNRLRVVNCQPLVHRAFNYCNAGFLLA